MGTNYYLTRKIKCTIDTPATIGITSDPRENSIVRISNGYFYNNTYYKTIKDIYTDFKQVIHIGKNSSGWKFTLAIYPKFNIHGIKDWIKLFKSKNIQIYDEDNNKISPESMIDIITKKKGYLTREDLENRGSDHNLSYKLENGLLCHPKDHFTIPQKGKTYDYIISGNDFDDGTIFS